MRRWLAILLILVPLAVAAQEEPGFFGRLFGGGDETEEGDGGGFLERQLENALSAAGRQVTVTGFQGALSSRATIEEMTIADDEGVWLTLRGVVLDWDRSALLRRRLEVTELSAEEILVPRLPTPGEPAVDVPSPEAQGFSLPELPVAVEIGQIEAERVALGEPLFGEEAVVSLTGELSLAGGAGSADIAAERIDGEEGTLSLDASYENETQELALDLSLEEGEDGIVANLIDLPGRPSLQLSAEGQGPLDDFEAEIALATDGEPRLTGTVALGEAEGGGRSFAVDLGGDVAPVFLPEYREFFGPDISLSATGATLPGGGVRVDSLTLGAEAIRLAGRLVVGPDGLPDLVDVSGRIAHEDGSPVLLPLSGPPTRVESATLEVEFDESVSEEWALDVVVSGLDREGFDAERIALDGTGTIDAGPPRSVTADLDFAATQLSLADGGAQEAIGEQVTGRAVLAWTEGEPLVLDVLTVDGETYNLEAAGEVSFGEALTVEGEATLTAEDLSAFSGIAGRPLDGSAELTVAGSGDPLAGRFDIAVDGTTQGLEVGIPQLDPLLAGRGDLTLRTERSDTGTRIETFRIETPELTAAGDGVLATGSSQVDLTARIANASLVADSLSGPVELTVSAGEVPAGWEFDVDAAGSGAEVAAEGTVDLTGLDPIVEASFDAAAEDLAAFSDLAGRDLAGQVAASGEVRTSLDLRRASIDAEAFGQGLAIGDPRIDQLLDGEVDVAVDAVRSGDVLRIEAFRLDAPDAQVTADGRIEDLTVQPVFEGDVAVSSPDLSPFSAIAGRDLGGSVEAEASGTLAANLSRFDLTVDAMGVDLDPGVAGAAAALDGQTTLSAEVARDGDQVEVARLELSNPQVSLSGSGVVTGLDATPAFDGELSVEAPDLAAFSELAGRELGGSVDAEASGTLAANLSRFDLTVDATAVDLDPGIAGAAAALAGQTTLSAEVARDGDQVEVARLELSNPQVILSGSGVVTGLDAAPAFDGELSVEAPDLAAFSELAGRDLGGELTARYEGVVAADLSAVDAELTARGQDLDLGLPGEELFPGEATLDVAAVREGDTITLPRLSLDSGNLTAEGTGQVRNLEATPVFDGQVSVAAETVTPFGGFVGRSLAGSVAAGVSGTVVADLSRFDLSADARAEGLQIGQADVDRLLAGTTTLDIDAMRADGVTTISAAELDAPGFDVSASGTLGEAGAEVELSATLADIGPYAPGFSGPVTVDGTMAQTDGMLRVDLDAGGPGNIAAAIDGTVDLSGPTLDLAIDGQAPLAAANRFVQPRALAGTAQFDLALQGAPGLDALSGTVTTSDARFVDPTFGIVLNDIDLTGQLSSGTLSVTADAAVDAGGSVAVEGTVGLGGQLPANLDVTLNDAVLQDPELYRTSVSGNVSFDGPLRGGGSITGELALGETELRVPSTGVGAGGAIPEITHVAEPAAVQATRRRAGLLRETMDGTETLRERRRVAHALNVGIEAENRIFVRGRGLDAELGGSLRLGGTTADIVPSGQFDLIRGRLDILGQRLTLDEGSVRLQGDFVPNIRLVAATETDDTDILVVVEGRLTEPDVNFLSEPELPEDEVLARLLFGRSIDEMSPLQAAQLAAAVAELTGRGGGLADQLRRNFGLDDLDITTSDEGGAALRAGKYLSENIYTDVVVDSEGETELNLNLEVTDSFTVKGGVDNEGGSSLGIFFERDY